MKKIIKTYKSDGYDFGTECPTCDYCGVSADETEIAENHVSGGCICGEIGCWNDYMLAEVWGSTVEVSEEEIEVRLKSKTYTLTEDEIMYIAERELPTENFFQDGEVNLQQAKRNLDYQLENNFISRITYDYYKEWESVL